MKKKLLSMLMALTLVLGLLPGVALAGNTGSALYVAGTDVISGGYWKGDGSGGLVPGDAANYTVHFDP